MNNRLGMTIVKHPRRWAAGVVAAMAGVLLAGALVVPVSFGAAPTGPPRFEEEHLGGLPRFFSTRAQIVVNLVAEHLATRWTAYYGPGPAGPWTEVNSGEISEHNALASNGERIDIGTFDHELDRVGLREAVFLRGLKPGTSYDARFVAKNADGEAEEVVPPFKTLPVDKP